MGGRGRCGSGSTCGDGAACPLAGVALGHCCPEPLHPTASEPQGAMASGGYWGVLAQAALGVSQRPQHTLLSPEMPKGRRRPVLSLRL